MKIDMPNVPELSEVPGAEEVNIQVTRVPCGICYTTRFFRGVEMLQEHQQIEVDRKYLEMQSSVNYPQGLHTTVDLSSFRI